MFSVAVSSVTSNQQIIYEKPPIVTTKLSKGLKNQSFLSFNLLMESSRLYFGWLQCESPKAKLPLSILINLIGNPSTSSPILANFYCKQVTGILNYIQMGTGDEKSTCDEILTNKYTFSGNIGMFKLFFYQKFSGSCILFSAKFFLLDICKISLFGNENIPHLDDAKVPLKRNEDDIISLTN